MIILDGFAILTKVECVNAIIHNFLQGFFRIQSFDLSEGINEKLVYELTIKGTMSPISVIYQLPSISFDFILYGFPNAITAIGCNLHSVYTMRISENVVCISVDTINSSIKTVIDLCGYISPILSDYIPNVIVFYAGRIVGMLGSTLGNGLNEAIDNSLCLNALGSTELAISVEVGIKNNVELIASCDAELLESWFIQNGTELTIIGLNNVVQTGNSLTAI